MQRVMAPEKQADKKKRTIECIRLLKRQYPDAKCSLNYKTVHQLMVATILSAQCTDERVNKTTPALFRKYRSVRAFAEANPDELGRDVFATGFHNSKARAIKESARQLLDHHHGRVPRTLGELVKLRGVGRKTASVILGAGFSLAEGIVVDTHVGRISRLLGLTEETDPVKVERDLMKIIPVKDWIIYAHLMISHGRSVCIARRPDCDNCILNRLCPSAGQK